MTGRPTPPMRDAVRVKDLDGERYLSRINCEMGPAADTVFDAQGVSGH